MSVCCALCVPCHVSCVMFLINFKSGCICVPLCVQFVVSCIMLVSSFIVLFVSWIGVGWFVCLNIRFIVVRCYVCGLCVVDAVFVCVVFVRYALIVVGVVVCCLFGVVCYMYYVFVVCCVCFLLRLFGVAV